MKFRSDHIKLESDEVWFFSDQPSYVSYDNMLELCLESIVNFDEALEHEFDALETARQEMDLADALLSPNVAEPLTTYLGGIMVNLNKVYLGYVDAGYADLN